VVQHFYWIYVSSQTICRALDNRTQASVVVANPTRVLFWSCSRLNAINATRIGSHISVGILVGGPSPPTCRPKSIGAVYDGNNRDKIREIDIDQPSALTIDTEEKMTF
jgi:hypothetical protein